MINAEGFVFICFSILLIAAAVWPTRREIRRERNILEPDKDLSAVESGSSIAASKIGSGLIITYSIFAMQYGWWALTFFAGYASGYFIYYFFAKSISLDPSLAATQSLRDFIFVKTQSKPLSLFVAILVALTMSAWILTNLIGGSKLLSNTANWSHEFSAIIISSTILTYLIFGGFKAVVRTDVVQIFALLGLFALAVIALANTHHGSLLGSENFSAMPLQMIASFFLVGALFPFGSAEVYERFSRLRVGEKPLAAVITSAAIYIAVGALLTVLCAFAKGSGPTIADNELILALGIKQSLTSISPLLPSLWILAFIAAIMSSADTYIYSATRSLTRDITISRNKDSSGRIAIMSVTICATLVATLIKSINYIIPLFLGITLVLSSITFIVWRFPKHSRLLFWAAIIGTFSCTTLWCRATFITHVPSDTLIIISGAALTITLFGFSLMISRLLAKRTDAPHL